MITQIEMNYPEGGEVTMTMAEMKVEKKVGSCFIGNGDSTSD